MCDGLIKPGKDLGAKGDSGFSTLLEFENRQAPLRVLRAKLSELSLKEKTTCGFSYSFENGHEIKTLFVADGISTFDFHTELRKRFSEFFKKSLVNVVRFDLSKLNAELQKQCLTAIVQLAHCAPWEPDQFGLRAQKDSAKGAKKNDDLEVRLYTSLKIPEAEKLAERGVILGSQNNLVRRLAELPSNFLNPEKYKKEIQARAKGLKYSYKFYDERALKKMNAGAFLAVTQGSKTGENGIVHLVSPGKSKNKKRVVLVGKGLCFDTGGYNIKTGNYMYGMQRDMTGSAVALALFEALIKLKYPLEVHALLAITENLVAPDAYKPNDVVIAMDGTSIEVVDTDAEGRMVLADTLALAKKQNPDLVLDFATLTGSAVRAVGSKRCAVFSNSRKMGALAVECGDRCGEKAWSFPVGEEYTDSLKSEIADVAQCVAGGSPDHIMAATFLSRFVGTKTPWLHVDLSADTNKGGLGLIGTETTGVGVRFGLEFIDRFF